MYKKISTITILCFIFFSILSPNSLSNELAEEVNSDGFSLRTIFAANPLIQITYEKIEERAIPNSGVIEIPLKISYKLSGTFANWQERKLRSRPIEIELSVIDKPDWCDASITNPLVDITLGDSEPDNPPLLRVSVNENAPAYTQGTVQVKATSPEISGLFFTRVKGGEVTCDVTFEVGYLPVLSLEIEESSMKIPPLDVTEIPIKLTNLGNGPTMVMIEIEGMPEKWIFNYPKSIILDSPVFGQEIVKKVDIYIKPSKYFSRETINISFTPSYIGRPDAQGKPMVLTIVLENDGSLKDEGLDFTLSIIVIVAIILIVILSIFLKRRHSNK